MPIVQPVAQSEPLSQGDILKDVAVFSSNWSAGEHTVEPCDGVIVVSRPCALANKDAMVVAAIKKQKYEKPEGCNSFEEVLIFLESQRSLHRMPDRFHLGQIPLLGDGTFRVHLDKLHTVKLPMGASRTDLVSKSRVGRLEPDFVRDFHLRIFTAFVSMGFDDYSWFSDKDLTWLVTAGQRELMELKQAFAAGDAGGGLAPKERESRTKAIATLEDTLAPYLAEHSRRHDKP